MKYPYIGELKSGSGGVVIFASKESAAKLNSEGKGWERSDNYLYSDEWDEDSFKNITSEYLSNTWGVVESKEHAEFIIELAELHEFGFGGNLHGMNYFYFNDVNLYITSFRENASPEVRKKITIPLPPKAKEWPRDKSSDIPQNEKRNKSKQAYEILKSLDYDYDLDKQKWFKKEYI